MSFVGDKRERDDKQLERLEPGLIPTALSSSWHQLNIFEITDYFQGFTQQAPKLGILNIGFSDDLQHSNIVQFFISGTDTYRLLHLN